MRSFFGPNAPVIDLILTHREYAFRRIVIAVKLAVRPLVSDDSIAERVSSSLVDLEREASKGDPADFPGPTKASKENTKGGPCSVVYLVRFPGQVLETNGRVEEDGTVVWRFYTEAAELQDITLHTVFRP